jgi:hypothetical protein
MPKRRRERDRPKAGPESFYNPNKRVLLSYGSDEEEETTISVPAVPTTTAVDAVNGVAAGESPIQPGDGKQPESHGEEADEDADEDDSKDEGAVEKQPQSTSERSSWTPSAKRNYATGQWPALGSLSYQWEDEEEAGSDQDSAEDEAMEYLKSVR